MKKLFWILLFIGLSGRFPADAVTLDLVNQSYSGESSRRNASLIFSITLSDNALYRGSSKFHEIVTNPSTNFGTGNIADFIGITWDISGNVGHLMADTGSNSSLDLDISFTQFRVSGYIRLIDQASQFAVQLSDGEARGSFASESDNCNSQGVVSQCLVSGFVSAQNIREPSSIIILSISTLILALGYKLRSIAKFNSIIAVAFT